MLPFAIITQSIVLSAAYVTASKDTYEHCSADIEKTAAVVEYIVSEYDLADPVDIEMCTNEINELCLRLDTPYIYALEIDEEAQSEKYIIIGFGKDATEEAKKTRYNGCVVKTELNDEIIETLHDDCEDHLRQVDNKFGNTLICYRKLHNDSTNTRIIGVEKPMYEMEKDLDTLFRFVFIFITILTFAIVLSFAFIVYRKVSRPARAISDKMSHFVLERSNKSEKYEKLEESGSLEFNSMAVAFNSMAEEINRYICNIESLNREKHMQEAELNIARNIQKGLMAPGSFNNRFVSIDAYMLPAKEVGGDMYDYKVYEDGEICISVADVSGKGVSASLFMARAVTLLQSFGQRGMSPAKSAEEFNNMLVHNNPKKLFITAFLAKYDPKTKKLTYTNAGHNPPYIISDELKMLDGAHGMAAGVFPDITYEETEITLKDGDALFMFTDGVNEAENKDGEMFTTERLESILSEHINSSKENIVEDVLAKIKEFTSGASQNDDITMLSMCTKNPFYKKLCFESDINNLTLINDAIDEIPDLSQDAVWELKLMAEEIYVNICKYSCENTLSNVEVIIESDENISMTFIDDGVEYDPTKELLNIEEYDHNNTVGGLGRFITFNTADDYSYKYENGKNILRLVKHK